MTIYAGNTGNITYSLTPNPCYDNVTYTSNNTGIATVSSSGVVTGVAAGQTTITVSAKKIDGTTSSALTTTVTVNVREKVATPVISFTPTAADNGATATAEITCSTPGTSIYYTINGGDPTTSSTPYNGTFSVNDGDIIKAIAIKTTDATFWDNSDVSTTTYTACETSAPTITYVASGSTVTVTIKAEDGATIYYTTNGSDPTASSASGTTIVTLNNLASGTTIKAYAKSGNCQASAIVSKEIITSGTSGGVVTLYDYEDHNWSYYSDASTPSELHSLNPADVKITYYGDGIMMTGSADYTASSTDFITSTHSDYKVGAKVNVGGENENTFIYYKTLERTDGSTSSNPTGRCPYKPIPNPFQVRPRYKDRGTTDANDFTGWRGFQCWRLKSVTNGAVYSATSGGTALSEGAVINAETEIYFAPAAEYGMEVELEAVWAIAYVKKANQANENPVGTNNVGYERNFCVPTTGAGYTLYTGNGKRITNANHVPVTISCYYPDGTAPDNTANSISNTATSLTADTKFENIPINMTSNTLTLANYDIIVGRGCIGTVNNLQGINAAATDLDYTIRLESGTFNQFCFVRSGTNTTVSGRYLVKAIMGSDYDRATNTNNKLIVSPSSDLFFARTVGFTGSSNKDQKTFDCVFKSGTYQSGYWNGTSQSGQNAYLNIAYLGQNSAQGNTYPGCRYVTVEGGEFGGMCGGRGVSSNSNNSTYMTPEVITFDLRIKGGTFHGAVFGGAADNPSIGSRRFIITGGEIQSWIAGGCNGTGSQSGTGATDGDSYIYVGGTTLVGGDNAMTINDTNGGQVFGAGRGISGRLSSVNYSYVAIADEAVVCNNNNTANIPEGGNVYGGSYNGTIADVSNVYILGGTVEGGAFGGSYGNGTAIPTANVTMTGGLVTGGVYGGSNNTGTVNNVEMHINGGQVGTSSANANVHGGGYGQATIVAQNVDVTVGTTTQTTPGAVVYGDVYGGSALGSVNGTAANTTYHTNVTLNKGTINGSLYGGALGSNTVAANVYGPVTVTVNGGTVNTTSEDGSGAVYGCNNINGAPQRAVAVVINGTDPAPSENTYALDAVYGGGNRASYAAGTPTVTVNNCDNSIAYVYGGGNAAHITNGNTDVTIYGGNKIGNVFGGGNGQVQAANISGNTNVKIYGGTIGRVFGGSNTQGTIGGTISVNVNKNGTCPMHIDEVYGGGNMAASQAGSISIGCTGGQGEGIGDVYGGANAANITGNVKLDIVGGSIERVFGGNNASGTISGTIQVNVNWDSTLNCGYNYLGSVFGGGNVAAYSGTPDVNIINGTVSGSVYGGGNEAGVGGGDVAMTGGTVLGGIYGGCNTSGTVDGDIVVNLTGGTVGTTTAKGNVHGGGYGSATATTGNIDVNINGTSLVIYGDVYGGSALGQVNSDTNDYTHVTLDKGTIHGDAYGGGLGDDTTAANVNGNVKVTQNGVAFVKSMTQIDANNSVVTAGRIFGCNNLNGSPKGTVLVLVNKTQGVTGQQRTTAANLHSDDNSLHSYELSAVYGGGNLAAYLPNDATATGQYAENGHVATQNPLQVIVNGCDDVSIEYVYGGGNAAATPSTDVLVLGAYELSNVFGGGNGKDKISRDGTTWTNNPGADVGIDNNDQNYGSGVSSATIWGGVVHSTFGGSNTLGNIRTRADLTIDENGSCPLELDEVYGGGNEAYMAGNAGITLGCISYLREIYGGAKNADVGSDVTLTITSGHFDRVFGGNNIGGKIMGSITVNIEETGCNPITIGELYGCGNQAAYNVNDKTGGTPSADPVINIKSFTSIGNVFGGGLGSSARVTGNPIVNINEVVGANATTASTYAGTTRTMRDGTQVELPAHTSGTIGAIGTIYGGGNAAPVVGNTFVNIGTAETISYISGNDHSAKTVKGVSITGNVFGGGLGETASVSGNTNVQVGRKIQ